MRIVIDASAVLAVLLDEDLREKIITQTIDAEVISPPSLPWEVGNALSANMKRNRISQSDALEAMKNFRVMDIRLTEIDLVDAIRISNQFGIYAYDAYVLGCAKSTKAVLLSLDQAMLRSAMQMGISVLDLE
jgi:predicted nucleic acid-binding protein